MPLLTCLLISSFAVNSSGGMVVSTTFAVGVAVIAVLCVSRKAREAAMLFTIYVAMWMWYGFRQITRRPLGAKKQKQAADSGGGSKPKRWKEEKLAREAAASGDAAPGVLLAESMPLSPVELKNVKHIISCDPRFEDEQEETKRRFVRGYCPKGGDPAELKEAVETYSGMADWREKHNVGALLGNPLAKADVFQRCWPSNVYGTDKEGHLVVVERVADINVDALIQEVGATRRHRSAATASLQPLPCNRSNSSRFSAKS